MSEAGWTGPSARARTRTTSKIKKEEEKKLAVGRMSCC